MTPKADYKGGRIPQRATPGLIWVACVVHLFRDALLVMDAGAHESALVSMDADWGGSFLPSDDPMHVTLTPGRLR